MSIEDPNNPIRRIGGKGHAPYGNKNAAKDRYVRKALLEAAEMMDATQRDVPVGDARVQMLALALKVWGIAMNDGERWAIEFIRDTVDGKPKQQTELTGEDGAPLLTGITVSLVKATNADSSGPTGETGSAV